MYFITQIHVVLIVLIAAISLLAWPNNKLFNNLIFNPYFILKKHQYYRTLTSGFIHSDWQHLLFNMISFYFFGSNVYATFQALFGDIAGTILFVCLFLVGILLSDLPTLYTNRTNPNFYSLGASGGVSSVIYASIMFFPLHEIYFFFIPFGIPGFIYGFLYLIYCSYAPGQFQKNVNHSAQLWGSVIGILFTIVIYPPVLMDFIAQIKNWKVF